MVKLQKPKYVWFGGRIAKCLVAHKDQLTDGCKSALVAEAAKQKAGGK